VGWALYIVFGHRASASIHGGTVTSLGLVVATLVALPVGIVRVGEKLLDWSLLPMGLAVALLSSVIPYSLEMMALKKLSRQTFGILMSLGPVVGCLLGAVFLKENLTELQWLAVACIVLASFGSSYTSNRRTPVPEIAP
jgi:inner membrane transporter RhtA